MRRRRKAEPDELELEPQSRVSRVRPAARHEDEASGRAEEVFIAGKSLLPFEHDHEEHRNAFACNFMVCFHYLVGLVSFPSPFSVVIVPRESLVVELFKATKLHCPIIFVSARLTLLCSAFFWGGNSGKLQLFSYL